MSNKIPCGGFYLDDMLNVNNSGELSIKGGTPYQQLVTDGDGNAKWEDRLAYVATEEQVIFSQENIEFKNWGDRYGYEIESPFGEIVIGQKYTVVWDGVTYPDLVAFDYGVPAIGAPDGNFTDELPFIIYTYDEEGLLVGFETLSVESTHSVTIFGPAETVHTIPQKWLPGIASETEPGLCPSLNNMKIMAASVAENEYHTVRYAVDPVREDYLGPNGFLQKAESSIPVGVSDSKLGMSVRILGGTAVNSTLLYVVAVGDDSILCYSLSNATRKKVWELGPDGLILPSSTADSTKQFRITVDDTGTISATEVT